MITVDACVICESRIYRLKSALVAPFLAKRIWDRKPFCVDLVKCEACGFMFYNPRIEGVELGKLYTAYRLSEYQAARNSFEPWYSRKMNADLASPESYTQRRAKLLETIKPHISRRTIKRVLDHGGDRGDLAAGLVEGATAYVYDISGVEPAEGVIAVQDPSSCRADLILNSNVLEHVGFPREIVSDLLRSAPSDGLVYIDVPCESPLGPYRIARRVAQTGISLLARPTTGVRMLRPSALYLMHEHINYFTENSLKTLFLRCGGGLIASGSYGYVGAAGRAEVAWCLGTKAY